MNTLKREKISKWLGGLGWALLFLGSSAAPCSSMTPEEAYSRFQPYITVQETYSDNIDLTPKNRREDFITTISPGLKFSTLPKSALTGQFPTAPPTEEGKLGMDLDYRLGLNFYAHQSEDNFVSHEGTLNAWYAPHRRFALRVREYIIRSEEPRERDYSQGALSNQYLLATQRERSVYIRNVVEPSMEYWFGPESLASLTYRHNVYHNENPEIEDSQEHFINPRIIYWFDIRNGVTLEYGFTQGEFQRSPDLQGHMARVRYTYRFNPKTSIFGEYMFLGRQFEAPGVDYNVHRPSVGVEHAFTSTLSARVQVGYFWQKPEEGSTVNDWYYDASVTQRGQRTTGTLSFQGGYAEDYFTSQNLGFVKYHRVLGVISHQLLERVTIGCSGSIERTRLGEERRDWTYGAGANISYMPWRWMTLSLEGSHRENQSNFEDSEYKENRAVLRVTLMYP